MVITLYTTFPGGLCGQWNKNVYQGNHRIHGCDIEERDGLVRLLGQGVGANILEGLSFVLIDTNPIYRYGFDSQKGTIFAYTMNYEVEKYKSLPLFPGQTEQNIFVNLHGSQSWGLSALHPDKEFPYHDLLQNLLEFISR